eukprot:CAMPEP_0184501294 /NCGR_PEP_ID=MMETSP0113_2-20130426/47233_1 /TAXON_ID=91329 /ORGANISM="Norrisiella sphaerica, Strain BC52" /LENGTH=535 /DNA_ID=CAMNT_0026890009 /DNA_START=150 /DNA_END=1754 /DNA_ORIENTATION=-
MKLSLVLGVFLLQTLSSEALSVGGGGGYEDLIVPPLKPTIGEDEVVIIFIQGASIKTAAYKPLAQQVQKSVSFPLWFAAPQCPENIAAIPKCIDEGVERVMTALRAKGLRNNSRIFYGGHSLGGAMIPGYVEKITQGDVRGMILLGSFLTREYRVPKYPNSPQYAFPVPTLTIGGELDGLARITRIAESFYNQITVSDAPYPWRRLPVTIIQGITHMQFASGQPPALVKERDLRPEVSEEEAHREIARHISLFLQAVLSNDDQDWNAVKRLVDSTFEVVSPIIEAFKMEAYHQFLPPCFCETEDEYGYRQYGTCVSNATCTGGTPWTEVAQKIIGGGLPGLKMEVVDSSHIVTEENPSCHLPHIHGNPHPDANPGNGKAPPICRNPKECELKVTTVTQQVYKNFGEFDLWRFRFNLSSFDTGYLPQSAFELRAKLKSRQAIWEAAGVPNVNYTESDLPTGQGGVGDRCGEINQAAIDWAMAILPNRTKQRYLKFGQSISTGPDEKTCVAGPCWIFDPLKWHEDERTGNVTVRSVW